MERRTSFFYISITTAIIYTEREDWIKEDWIFSIQSDELYVTRLTYNKHLSILVKGCLHLESFVDDYLLYTEMWIL